MRALGLMGSRIVAAGCALLLGAACGARNDAEPAVRTEMVAVDAATGRQLWRTPLDEQVIGSPVVADGLVYVYGGSYHNSEPRGRLFALSASTGTAVWQADTHGGQFGGALALHKIPQVAGGVVVLRDPAGQLRGLDTRSGRERWRVPTGDVPVGGTPTRVIVAVPGPGPAPQSPDALRALDRRTGRTLWTTTFRPGELTGSRYDNDLGAPVPAATDSVVLAQIGPDPYLFPSDSGLVALDAVTGRERWRTTLGYDVAQARPVLAEPTTVVTLRGPSASPGETPPAPAHAIDALDVTTGTPRWSRPVAAAEGTGEPVTTVWAGTHTVYFFADGVRLIAADARTGRLRWQSTPLRSTPRGIPDPATVTADTRIVVLTGAAGVSALAAADGSQLWRIQQVHIPAPVTPAIGDGVVLLPQSDG